MPPRTAPPTEDRHAGVGAAIAERRKALKLTQVALAEAAGIDRGTLASIEQGKRRATDATLRVIAKALGTTLPKLTEARPAVVAAPVTEAPPIMTTAQVSELLQVAVGTLKQWRSTGTGPPSFRMGGLVRYRRADVLAWVDAQYSVSAS